MCYDVSKSKHVWKVNLDGLKGYKRNKRKTTKNCGGSASS